MKKVLSIAAAIAAAGCMTPPSPPASAVVTAPQAKLIAPELAMNAVAIGRSTRADVAAALGETLAIRFDTGFEVWVYRLAGVATGRSVLQSPVPSITAAPPAPETSAEFVILFDAAGRVAKTRIRPAARPRPSMSLR